MEGLAFGKPKDRLRGMRGNRSRISALRAPHPGYNDAIPN